MNDRNARRIAALFISTFALIAGGCNDDTCESYADCGGGELCLAEQCGGCKSSAQCGQVYGQRYECIEGACTLTCELGQIDCDCDNGQCRIGATCDDGTCVAAVSCGQLTCADEYRECNSGPNGAECGPCLGGYVEIGGLCERDGTATCEELEASCLAEHRLCMGGVCGSCLDGYIEADGDCIEDNGCRALACESQNRSCDAGPPATCGACLDGFREDSGRCLAVLRCATDERPEGPNVLACGCGQVCTEPSPHEDAYCAGEGCGPGSICNPDAPEGQQCVACPACGQRAGETGQPVGQVTRSGQCICDTQDGYYYAPSSLRTEPCDEDGDGWTRLSAHASITSTDPVVSRAARCRLRTVDRLVFASDQGDDAVLVLTSTITLYEKERLDHDVRTPEAMRIFPSYGSRPLSAAELNPLTKACVSSAGDHNDNGILDIEEHANSTLSLASFPSLGNAPGVMDMMRALQRFTHFVELHDSWYEPAAANGPGRYHIAERPRTAGAGAVPMSVPTGANGSEYWRECARYVDASYDPSTGYPATGHDLASVSRDGSLLPPMGPAFAGMTHHSQFKCLQVVAQADLPANRAAAPELVAVDELTSVSLNGCGVEGTPVRAHGTDNPARPELACAIAQNASVVVGDVVWAAHGYHHYVEADEYTRGCANECLEDPPLAPQIDRPRQCWNPSNPPPSTVGYACNARQQEFGRLGCGCDRNFDGPSCQSRCADPDLLESLAEIAPRDGIWMCGHVAASESPTLQAGSYTLRGEVSPTGGGTEELNTMTPTGGITLRAR